MGKDKIYSINSVGNIGQIHANKMKLDHNFIPHTKINLKWIEDLNVSCETIKILEENIGSKISDILIAIFSLIYSPRARKTKEKLNKWNYIKLKRFCTVKENINKMERQSTE